MIAVILFFLLSVIPLPGKIHDYRPYFAHVSKPGQETQIIIRKFQQDKHFFYLTVGANDLKTGIVPASNLCPVETTWPDLRKMFAKSPYFKAVALAEMNAKPRQDAGITHFLRASQGIYLTIDLCPSQKPLKRSLFDKIISVFGDIEKPVPLAISITGRWMAEHPTDLDWILNLIKKNKISVEWINHSYHHRYNKELPLSRNFLLEKGTNIDKEILYTEIKMIKKGLVPPVFFRFPGLISDDDIFKEVISYGLIPIGTDAWLAKSETPTPGSIVLVHGNGNEPLGIKKLFELLQKEKENIRTKKWLLLNLRKSLQ